MNFKRIKVLRVKRKMTQKDLAIKLNVDRSCIAKWETGKSSPRIASIEKLCKIFKCSIQIFCK